MSVYHSISDVVLRFRKRREWDGPAALPPPKALMVRGRLVTRRSTTMPRTATVHAVTAIGIDMGKNTLHMVGLDTRGTIVLREKVSRGRITSRLANLPPCLIGIDAGHRPDHLECDGCCDRQWRSIRKRPGFFGLDRARS